MDLDTPRVDESADRLAVADVHAHVLEVAPDDEVTGLRIVLGDLAARLEPVVVRLDAAIAADAVLHAVLVEQEPHVADAIELVGALGVVNPRIAELGLAQTEKLAELG